MSRSAIDPIEQQRHPQRGLRNNASTSHDYQAQSLCCWLLALDSKKRQFSSPGTNLADSLA